MAKELLAFALGERWIPGSDADAVEAVQIDGVAWPISLGEAEAMGADVKRVAWADESATSNIGREMVRYADMALGSREKAEARGFSIKLMPKSMRATIDRDHARSAADDAAFATKQQQRLGRKPTTVDKPQASESPPEPTLSAYEAAVLSLDEASVRPQAARLLLEMHNDESSLPIHQAAAILAALPFETRQSIEVPLSQSHNAEDAAAHALLVRVTEICSLGLSQRGARGDADARAEARKLNAALQDYRSTGTNIVAALNAQGADMAPIADQARRAAR